MRRYIRDLRNIKNPKAIELTQFLIKSGEEIEESKKSDGNADKDEVDNDLKLDSSGKDGFTVSGFDDNVAGHKSKRGRPKNPDDYVYDKVVIGIRIPIDLKKKFDLFCESHGYKKSFIMEKIIREKLDEYMMRDLL